MGKTPVRPYLCLGWVACFFWPLAVGAVLFVLSRLAQSNEVVWLFCILFLGGAAGVPLWYAVAGLITWLDRFFASPRPYGCPMCGHDIRMSPHRCPQCGTRLVWGQLPHSADRTAHRLTDCIHLRRL